VIDVVSTVTTFVAAPSTYEADVNGDADDGRGDVASVTRVRWCQPWHDTEP
jgi:hypothetical protein